MKQNEKNSDSIKVSVFKDIEISKPISSSNTFQPNRLLFFNFKTAGMSSQLTCFSILTNIFYSISPFFLPSFFQNGLLQAIIYILFSAIISFFSYALLIRIWMISFESKYTALSRQLFGQISVPFMILFLYFSFLAVTVTAMNDTSVMIQNLVNNFYPRAPFLIKDRWFPSLILTLIATIICSSGKRLNMIKYFALV
jgi:glycerol uptake facilitator-like aquaporin